MHLFVFSRKPVLYLLMFLLVICFWGFLHYQYLSIPSLVKDPETYYIVRTQEKVTALTFDDGPDPLYTGTILDILQTKNIKATFFILGQNAKQNPDLMKRILNEGHEIGNHGYSHSYIPNKFIDELIDTDKTIFQSLNQQTLYYRPPGGIITKSIVKEVTANGQILTLWSVDSKDWQNPGPKQIEQNVVKNIFPGSIILLHDGGEKREQTIQALTEIIEKLQQQGYRFVTLSDLKQYDADITVQKNIPPA
ncbi:MAG: polysaccharide deacetylase family protein [Desulfitobacteriaceae bacterium]|nr:polysaccharide deacetylase family protein [Desulfitobacteriaceae bacterium]